MTKLKNENLKGLRLWLSVNDMETFALLANPGMSSEQILDLIQTMDTQDWLVLFKKFAMTFHQSQQSIPLESYPKIERPVYSQFALEPSPTLIEETLSLNLEKKPDLDLIDDLDFDD